MSDPVNHPKHYTSDPSGIECIEITRHRNFNIGNAMKYLWRAGIKDEDTQVQDLEKAIWYLHDEIYRLKKLEPTNEVLAIQYEKWSFAPGYAKQCAKCAVNIYDTAFRSKATRAYYHEGCVPK